MGFILRQPNTFSEAWGERSDDAVERWVRSDVWCHLAISHAAKVLVATLNNFEKGSSISNKSPELFIITVFEELGGHHCLGKLCFLKWLCSGIIGPMGNVACLHHYNTKSGACVECLSLQLISKVLTEKSGVSEEHCIFISSNRSSENKKKASLGSRKSWV